MWPVDKSARPQPSGLVQPRRRPAARERGARAGRTHGVVTALWPRVRRWGGMAGPCAPVNKVPWERRHEHRGGSGNAPDEVAVAMARPSSGSTCGGGSEAARRCPMVVEVLQ
jgi:hypothetical protein